jgi:ribosomal protein S12 methylthiotransferase accessory factor
MPAGPRPLREGRRGALGLARALGVTRVARLTGLDRTGIEVASAIRPRGHVLQVTNGKGERFGDAAAGALMEAAELAAAELAVVDAWGSAAELAARGVPGTVLAPRALAGDGGDESWDALRVAWRAGRDLATGAPVLVPAHAVHVPPADGPGLGPAMVRWTSNGMAAARDRGAAVLHALLEAIERDRLARALPDGFTEGEVARRLVDPAPLDRLAPRTAALVRRIEGRGFGVHLLDLTAASRGSPRREEIGLPCAAALVVDVEGGPVPVAAGYACRLSRDAALHAALLEAAQSRATEIHGAREDVAVSDRHSAVPLRGMLARARAVRDPALLPDVRVAAAPAALREILLRLGRAGFRRAVAVDLRAPAGIAVVKVLVPGLLLSELL